MEFDHAGDTTSVTTPACSPVRDRDIETIDDEPRPDDPYRGLRYPWIHT